MTRAATTSWQRLTSSIKDCFGGVRWVQTSMGSACELHSVGVTGRFDGHRLHQHTKSIKQTQPPGPEGCLPTVAPPCGYMPSFDILKTGSAVAIAPACVAEVLKCRVLFILHIECRYLQEAY